MVKGNMEGDVAFYGQGAGGLATASAVLSDIIEAIKLKTLPILKNNPFLIKKDINLQNSVDIYGINFPVI